MATIIKNVGGLVEKSAGGRKGKWNWPLLTNGQVHLLKASEDFQLKLKWPVAQIRGYAESKAKTVKFYDIPDNKRSEFGLKKDETYICLQFADIKAPVVTEAPKSTRSQRRAAAKK